METIYTIGHSTHSLATFLSLLTEHRISAVADVRSEPYSRFNPQFDRDALRAGLAQAGISYVFLGRELGARREEAECYLDGVVQYDCIARTELFQAGLQRVLRGASTHRVALLCAEKDPLVCHRTVLISRHLAKRGAAIAHILEDGRLESHQEAVDRLLSECGLGQSELFDGREELVAEAYTRREKRIAYRSEPRNVGAVSGGE